MSQEFETLAAATAATIPSTEQLVIIDGFAASGDGGGGDYRKVASEPSQSLGKFQSADGAWWQLLPDIEGFVSFRQLGAIGDGSTDDRDVFAGAAGMAVTGTVGDVYYFDIDSYTDSVELTTGTDWKFPIPCQIKWDGFGMACFFANESSSNIRIDTPQMLYDATVTQPTQYNSTELRAFYGGPPRGPYAYIANFLFLGADDVEILSSSTQAVTPGSGKSIYAHVRCTPKADNSVANRIVISDITAEDYCFGVLGAGYSEMRLPGSHVFGRYDDYDTIFGGAGATHTMYWQLYT